MEDIILVGYGGHAKSVADTVERGKQYRIAGYTEIKPVDSRYEYLGGDEALPEYYKSGIRNAVVCIGYLGKGSLRQKIYKYLKDIGFVLPVILDPSAIISSDVQIGEGTFVGKNAIINAGVKIGKMAIINTQSLVEHECIVSDFTHIAVSAVLCGQVHVGEAAFVGANATVIQERNIPAGKIVPAGVTIR